MHVSLIWRTIDPCEMVDQSQSEPKKLDELFDRLKVYRSSAGVLSSDGQGAVAAECG